MRYLLLFFLAFLLFCNNTFAVLNQKSNTQNFSEISATKFKAGDIEIKFPTIIISDVEVSIDVKLLNQKQIAGFESKEIRILLNGKPIKVFMLDPAWKDVTKALISDKN